MKAKTVRPLNTKKTATNPTGVWPTGTVIDNPDAWKLVTAGAAVPFDEECVAKVSMTPEQLAAAQHAYARLTAGIHPDDWAAFDAGEMIGYDAQGRKIPGPNFHGGEADFHASAELTEHDTLA